MSFVNRMLASVGIGSAKVDTVLDKAQFTPGEAVTGVIQIKGGNIDQNIESIYIHLMTEYIKESDDKRYTVNEEIQKFLITNPIRIQSNEYKEIPFSFILPLQTPTTIGSTPVWLKTGVDIEMAIDPSDKDYIDVLPHFYVQKVLDAVSSLGFRTKSILCEHSHRFNHSLPFVQEFEFFPSNRYSRNMKELELVFFVKEEGLEVIVEVDRRARGIMGLLEGALDLDERKQRLFLNKELLQKGNHFISSELESAIDAHIH